MTPLKSLRAGRSRLAFLATAAWLFPAAVAFAQSGAGGTLGYSNFVRIIDTASSWAYGILLAVAVLFVILGAYRFLTAASDPKSAETGRRQILYAVIAVVVAMLAKTIIASVGSFLVPGGGGVSDPPNPITFILPPPSPLPECYPNCPP